MVISPGQRLPHGFFPTLPPSSEAPSGVHWANIFLSAGALAAVLGFTAGVILAILYSRKATAEVTADVHTTLNGTILAVRPSVAALGALKLQFEQQSLEVSEVLRRAEGHGTEDGFTWPARPAFPADMRGKEQFVSPGETLTSSAIYDVDPKKPRLVGWVVCLNIKSKGLIRHGLNWSDRIFVPLPADRLPSDTETGGPHDG